MKRRLDLTITANEFQLEIDEIVLALKEMIEDGSEHGIIDMENRQFVHFTDDENRDLINLLSKDTMLINDIAQELELPSNAIKEWIKILINLNHLQGTFNAAGDSFIPFGPLLPRVKDSFEKSGMLGITEAAIALQIQETDLRKCLQILSESGDLEGYYTLDNEFFITSRRLEEDIIDYLGEEHKFFIQHFAVKLNLQDTIIKMFIEKLLNLGKINGVISETNEFISDKILDQALVDAIKPFSRISITELSQSFGFNEKNMKSLIVRAISKGLIIGSIDSVSNEFVKERVVAPLVEPEIPKAAELIDVKRDYDYLGGDIRFKVALRNTTPTAVSKLSVLLNVPDQFQINKNVDRVEILNPNETRGVDFVFTPLACGKAQIFGTVSYTDAFGEPHSVTIRPKEVWVKCPLVKSQQASANEADLWKQELQKSTSTIDSAGITQIEAFRIACEQITALDLAEVEQNEVELIGTFSGIAKVTGDRLLVEISMGTNKIILDIYTSDQKQATGFLAYMRNLIKISLDVSRKLRVKSEKLGLKVLTSFQIARGLFNLCDYCEIRSPICDFLLQMKEIIFKITKEFPEVKFVSEVNAWLEELLKFDENASIPEAFANALEYDALMWLKEIESLAENTAVIYLDSFDTREEARDRKIGGGIIGIQTEIQQKEINYSLRVAHYLLIIHKISGLCLYNYKFSPGEFDPDLMSGFLQAIQSFGAEFSASEESGMRRLSYRDFEITLEESEYVRVALVGIGKITTYLEDHLKEFVNLFNSQFREHLVDFTGNINVFEPTEDIIKSIFEIPQARPEGGER